MSKLSEPSITETTDRIKALGLKAGAKVIGIADVKAFNEYVPSGHRPADILPGARSVVVAGCQGPTAGAWRCENHRVMEITGYDFRENIAVHAISDFITDQLGYQAVQGPAMPTEGHRPPMSMMLAAVLSGLGTRSLAANIILNPTYGLLYYAALITTLPLIADQQLDENVCPAPMCVKVYEASGKTPCMASCPADEGGCLDGKLDENGRIESSYYDRERCHARSMTYGMGSFQKSLLDVIDQDDSDKRKSMIYSDFFTDNLTAISFFKDSVAQCFECMRVCPVGKTTRTLK